MAKYASVPLKIVAVYALTGCLWIVFSDRAVSLLTSDPEMITAISIAKGWLYVLLTAILLYWLIQRYLAEIRQSMDKLKASEEKFSIAFSHSPALMTISVIDSGRCIEVNEKFCQVSGFSRREAIGHSSVELGWITAADRARMITCLRRDGRVADMEIALHARSGATVPCLCSAVPVTIEEQQYLLSIALDITDRKKDMEALDYVNECFTQALSGPQHILYRLNVKRGAYDYLSPAFEAITGHRVAEFKTYGLEKVKEFFHPDDRTLVFASFEAAFLRRSGATVNFDLEYRFRKADGGYCWLHDYATACFNDNDELECFFGSVYDTTGRKEAAKAIKESEERYRRFSSLTTDYVYACRRSGEEPFITQWMGGAIEEITGYPMAELMAWGCWLPIVHPDDVQRISSRLRSLLPGDTASNEFRLVRKDGEIRWIHEACSCEQGAAPGELVLYGTSRDITKRKAAEEAVNKLNEHLEQLVAERTAELERSNEELASFSYAVSHELRAPITRLQGFSAIIVEISKETDDIAFLASRIASASNQLQSVVDSILMLSRLSRMELSLQQVDLSGMVKRKVDLLVAENPQRCLEVIVKPCVSAVADPDLMEICLDNLLGNAFKYTGQSAAARIEFGLVNDSGQEVYFVKDNGAGFDMNYADKLYAPFQRLHQHHEFPGAGIGLATVKRIIERHGGELWAESSVGEGATFYFTLGCTGSCR